MAAATSAVKSSGRVGLYVGERCDLIRHDGGGLRLAWREVRLDHTVVFAGPVSTLF